MASGGVRFRFVVSANAMSVSTVDAAGVPHARFVDLKEVRSDGVVWGGYLVARGAGAIALLALGYVVLLGWAAAHTISENPFILFFGLPGFAAPLFLLPWLLLAGSMTLVAAAIAAWKREAWTRAGRIHFALVAAASAAFTAVVFGWGLI